MGKLKTETLVRTATALASAFQSCPSEDMREAQRLLDERKNEMIRSLPETESPYYIERIFDPLMNTCAEKATGEQLTTPEDIAAAMSGASTTLAD